MKTAASGWIDGRWHFTRQDDLLALDVGMRRQCGGEQGLGVGMQGTRKQRFSGTAVWCAM
jgi:hypothetical protein